MHDLTCVVQYHSFNVDHRGANNEWHVTDWHVTPLDISLLLTLHSLTTQNVEWTGVLLWSLSNPPILPVPLLSLSYPTCSSLISAQSHTSTYAPSSAYIFTCRLPLLTVFLSVFNNLQQYILAPAEDNSTCASPKIQGNGSIQHRLETEDGEVWAMVFLPR